MRPTPSPRPSGWPSSRARHSSFPTRLTPTGKRGPARHRPSQGQAERPRRWRGASTTEGRGHRRTRRVQAQGEACTRQGQWTGQGRGRHPRPHRPLQVGRRVPRAPLQPQGRADAAAAPRQLLRLHRHPLSRDGGRRDPPGPVPVPGRCTGVAHGGEEDQGRGADIRAGPVQAEPQPRPRPCRHRAGPRRNRRPTRDAVLAWQGRSTGRRDPDGQRSARARDRQAAPALAALLPELQPVLRLRPEGADAHRVAAVPRRAFGPTTRKPATPCRR